MNNESTPAELAARQEEENLRRFVDGFGEQVLNCNLLCARCANLWEDEASECEVYSQKPLAVLRGGDQCPDFIPREG